MRRRKSKVQVETIALAIDIVFVMMASIFVLSVVTIDLDSIRPPKSFLEKEKFAPEEGVSVRIDSESLIFFKKTQRPLEEMAAALRRENPRFVQIVADRSAEARQVKGLIDLVVPEYPAYLIYLPN